ncbi:MAG: hypothetical protein SGI86_15225 [Deltaproteobacteria bacterium]|nr:hypothetical protein [Deltaproteobacteria bacterium]
MNRLRQSVYFLAYASTFLLSCSETVPTEIVVIVEASDGIRSVVSDVQFSAQREGEEQKLLPLAKLATRPLSFALLHEVGSLSVQIVVRGKNAAGTDVIKRQASTEFVPGRIKYLRMDLYDECRSAACGEPMTCTQSGCIADTIAGGWLLDDRGVRPAYTGLAPDAGTAQTGGTGGSSLLPTDGGMGGAGGTVVNGGTGGTVVTGGTGGTVTGGMGGTVVTGGVGGTVVTGGAGGWAGDLGTCNLAVSNGRLTTPLGGAVKTDLYNTYLAELVAAQPTLVPEFGGQPDRGFPWISVPEGQPKARIMNTLGGLGPNAPVPPDAPMRIDTEQLIVLQLGTCATYEGYRCSFVSGQYRCQTSSTQPVSQDSTPQAGTEGGDPSGLALLPLLIRKDEIDAGQINHALRMTISRLRNVHVFPAISHRSSETSTSLPPFGAKIRLKSSAINLQDYGPEARVVLQALITYGAILTSEGTSFAISGEKRSDWAAKMLTDLAKVPTSALELMEHGTVVSN